MRHRPAFVLFFILLGVAVPLRAQQQPSSTSADAVVRKALADQQRMSDLLEKYSFRKHIISETAEMNGRVTGHEERVYGYAPCSGKNGEKPTDSSLAPSDGRMCIVLESVDGKPPTEKQRKEHAKMMKKAWELQSRKTAADRKKEDDEDLFLSRDFLTIYDFQAGESEMHAGTSALIVAFTPKNGKLALANGDNKVLTKFAGRLWIADVDQKIVAAELHMVKPIKVWGGFAGAINNMTVQQEYLADGGTYLPRKNTVEIELRILFSKGKLRLTEEYMDFKPEAPAAGGQ
jgi:hypothetical protein